MNILKQMMKYLLNCSKCGQKVERSSNTKKTTCFDCKTERNRITTQKRKVALLKSKKKKK